MGEWEYTGGGHGPTWGIRTYQHINRLVGKVVRTHRGRNNGEWGKGRIKFFAWDRPRREFTTYQDALKAARQ